MTATTRIFLQAAIAVSVPAAIAVAGVGRALMAASLLALGTFLAVGSAAYVSGIARADRGRADFSSTRGTYEV